jgi:hypothetical protein
MSTLKYKADLALEGSDRSDAALVNVRDYLHDLHDRSLFAISDIQLAVEIHSLLRRLKEQFDPEGASPYRLQIVRRNEGKGGRPPNPQRKRIRENDGLFAALYADRCWRRILACRRSMRTPAPPRSSE